MTPKAYVIAKLWYLMLSLFVGQEFDVREALLPAPLSVCPTSICTSTIAY